MVFGKSPLQAAEDALDATKKELDASNRKVRALQGEVESYMIKLSTLQTAMQDLEAQLQVKEHQMTSLKAILAGKGTDSLEQQLYETQHHASVLEEQLQASQRLVAELQEDVEQLELSSAYTAYASTQGTPAQGSPAESPTASAAEVQQLERQEHQRRRAARKQAIVSQRQQLKQQVEQLQVALQKANGQLHILGGTPVQDPLSSYPEQKQQQQLPTEQRCSDAAPRTAAVQQLGSPDLPGTPVLGIEIDRSDTQTSLPTSSSSTAALRLNLGEGRPTRSDSTGTGTGTGTPSSVSFMTERTLTTFSSGQEVAHMVAEVQGLHKLLATLLQVTSEAGSQAAEARQALRGSAQGLAALHELAAGIADLMSHDQLSSAASQALLGEQLVASVQRLGECARSQQQVAARVEAVAQMMHYVATRAPLELTAHQ